MKARIGVVPASTAEPASLRSLVSAPAAASSATKACVLLLATVGDSAVGSLRLTPASPFQVHASSLRLPEAGSVERDEIASSLLWHAAREMPALRGGSALIARPDADDDDATLRSLGFAPASADSEPPLALVQRRDPAEPGTYSHTVLRVSAIRQCLDFWSLLHFAPSRVFTTSGARAAWLSAPWTSLSLELIEVPEIVLRQTPKHRLRPSDESLGTAHLVVDVTALGVSLQATLALLQACDLPAPPPSMPFPAHPLTFCLHATRELLQARSVARFGKTLHVLMPPHQQMMGTLVSEVAVVRAPDGVQLRLTHHTGYVERPMEPDWSVADKAPAKAYDEAAVLALVEAQIATTGAILYARSTCPYCEQAKAALTEMGAAYTAIDLDLTDDGVGMRAELTKLTGHETVPLVFVGGRFVGGCNDGGLGGVMPLKESGRLAQMLAEAGAGGDAESEE